MSNFVIGDIHGAKRALDQVLERANFDPSSDHITFLGDVADGWPDVVEVFEFILGLDNYGYLMGNHDYWLYEYLKFGATPAIWLMQGGQNTVESYIRADDPDINDKHRDFLQHLPFYIEDGENLFVHGGFMTAFPIKNQSPHDLMWDRDLWWNAKIYEANEDVDIAQGYKQVFIGHTNTLNERSDLTPIKASNVWNLDQGAGYHGKLTLMDVETNEFWQSDEVNGLYPGVRGR